MTSNRNPLDRTPYGRAYKRSIHGSQWIRRKLKREVLGMTKEKIFETIEEARGIILVSKKDYLLVVLGFEPDTENDPDAQANFENAWVAWTKGPSEKKREFPTTIPPVPVELREAVANLTLVTEEVKDRASRPKSLLEALKSVGPFVPFDTQTK